MEAEKQLIKQQNSISMNVRPQDRKIKGLVIFTRKSDGLKESYPKAYSIPMQRCEGCPVYRIDKDTEPVGYYCQCDFVSSYVFSEYVKNKEVPESCKIRQTKNIHKYARLWKNQR